MVVAHALCLANLASAVLANGVCCCYEMRREEERKSEQQAAIRQTIHSEWERQRYLDMIQQKVVNEELSSQLQDARRSHLMAVKQAVTLSNSETVNISTTDAGTRGQPQVSPQRTLLRQRSQSSSQSGSVASTFSRPDLKSKTPDVNLNHRHSSGLRVLGSSPSNSYDAPLRNLSSLMDDCDEEMEEVYIE